MKSQTNFYCHYSYAVLKSKGRPWKQGCEWIYLCGCRWQHLLGHEKLLQPPTNNTKSKIEKFIMQKWLRLNEMLCLWMAHFWHH